MTFWPRAASTRSLGLLDESSEVTAGSDDHLVVEIGPDRGPDRFIAAQVVVIQDVGIRFSPPCGQPAKEDPFVEGDLEHRVAGRGHEKRARRSRTTVGQREFPRARARRQGGTPRADEAPAIHADAAARPPYRRADRVARSRS